uniref:Ribosomal protein S7 n=1 Tax=Medakamo hakoo TaxID=3113649 RepID=A0A8D5TC92_9CHLO|nr:ribosomal protein S7 [Medakamo hakoo]
MKKLTNQQACAWIPKDDNFQQIIAFQKFVSCLMKDGKKQRAFFIMSNALDKAVKKLYAQNKDNTHVPSMNFIDEVVENVRPSVEVRSKKIAGVSRDIPSLVPPKRGQGIAIRWILESARGRKQTASRTFIDNLSDELLDAYLKRGTPRQKRDSLHKTASTNRAFLRYRWW